MAERVFAMPDLGEGLEEGEIVAWLVAANDDVTLNQPLVEVETAKATVEIPSPFAGRIMTLHGAIGEAVPVGSPLVTFALPDGDASVVPLVTTPVAGLATSNRGTRGARVMLRHLEEPSVPEPSELATACRLELNPTWLAEEGVI